MLCLVLWNFFPHKDLLAVLRSSKYLYGFFHENMEQESSLLNTKQGSSL